MHVFITGATGVVGRRAVPRLTRAGHLVTAVARTPGQRARLARHGARAIGLDLFDRAAVIRAVEGHDAVINLATHIPRSSARMFLPGAWRENDRIRREASALLADAARAAGAARFIQEAFGPIYQDQGDAWVNETVPQRPAAYNRSVLDAERAALGFSSRGGIGIALRFAWFYGPDSRFFEQMLATARRGRLPFPGGPAAFFSQVSHDDAAAAVVAALDLPEGIYNVVEDEPLTRGELAAILTPLAGQSVLRPLPGWMVRATGSVGELMSRSVRMSNRKLRESSPWRPAYPSAREGWAAAVAELREAA
jgi:nucleoside-diphosphate-sugar epimerase